MRRVSPLKWFSCEDQEALQRLRSPSFPHQAAQRWPRELNSALNWCALPYEKSRPPKAREVLQCLPKSGPAR